MTVVMTCPQCGAPTTFGAMSCGYCRAPLTWDQIPQLQPGPARFHHSFSQGALGPVSTPTFRVDERGATFQLPQRGMNSGAASMLARHGAVRLSGKTHDEGGAFGVLARISTIVGARMAYALTLRPGTRSVQLTRMIWADGKTVVRPLRPWICHPAIHPAGEDNLLELRFADSVLQTVVNDTPLGAIEDASFRFGAVGWRTLTYTGPSAVWLGDFTVCSLE